METHTDTKQSSVRMDDFDLPSDPSAGLPGTTGGPRLVDPISDTPPLLIGGVKQQIPNKGLDITLSGVGFDYLTVTVPSQTTAEILVHHSAFSDEGKPSTGFKNSERRECMGGFCWRKFEPHQPSKRWGKQYESWEYSGLASVTPLKLLMGHDCKPTRIDIAFDFCVSDELYPMDLEPLFLDHCESKGIDIEWKGKRLKQTVYVGSQQSERRIRIYRRDLKNMLLHEEGIHILRVELELKGDMALAFWRHMNAHGQQAAYEAASAHIAHMIGYAPIEAGWDLPEVLRSNEDADAYQMMFQFIKQNAVMIEACNRCGIDVFKLARSKVERSKSRTTRHRLNQKVQVLASLEPSEIERMLTIHL